MPSETALLICIILALIPVTIWWLYEELNDKRKRK
jgi:hypothetical protein